MNPAILRVIGPGFLNQVPTLDAIFKVVQGFDHPRESYTVCIVTNRVWGPHCKQTTAQNRSL